MQQRSVLGPQTSRTRSLGGAGSFRPAGEEVEVEVSTRSAAQHHPVRMESGCRDRRSLATLQEARIWLNRRDLVAVEVEDLDLTVRGAAANPVVSKATAGERGNVFSYIEKTGRCSCVLAVLTTSVLT